jgi:hypothetical protein
LQVTVGRNGKPAGIKVVRAMPGFTERAAKAAKMWRLHPAEFDGARVESNVAVVFVFAPPRLNPRAARESRTRTPSLSRR